MSSGFGVARVECVRVAETGFGSRTNQTPSRPPSSTVLDAYSTASTAAHPRLLHLVMTAKPTRAFSPNLSTALRPAHTRNAGSFPVSTPEADYTRTHDSEQRRAAAIAQHNSTKIHTVKFSTKLCLSTVNALIPGGLAISSPR